jgi:hypothetical protein
MGRKNEANTDAPTAYELGGKQQEQQLRRIADEHTGRLSGSDKTQRAVPKLRI